MTLDQFHRENVAQAWHEWTPPKDSPKWESGACFITFIRERYAASQKKLDQQPNFDQTRLFDEVE